MAYVRLASGYQQELAGLGQLLFPAGSPYYAGGGTPSPSPQPTSYPSAGGAGWSAPVPISPTGVPLTTFQYAPLSTSARAAPVAPPPGSPLTSGPVLTPTPPAPTKHAPPILRPYHPPSGTGPGAPPLVEASAPPVTTSEEPNYLLWGGLVVVVVGVGYYAMSGKKKKGRR
jgi:hypothetical protein